MMIAGTHTPKTSRSGSDARAARLRAIVSTILRIAPERARGDATLVRDLGATSLDFVELVMAVEDEFGIEITDTEADKLDSVDDLVALVERAQEKQGALAGSHRE